MSFFTYGCPRFHRSLWIRTFFAKTVLLHPNEAKQFFPRCFFSIARLRDVVISPTSWLQLSTLIRPTTGLFSLQDIPLAQCYSSAAQVLAYYVYAEPESLSLCQLQAIML